MTPARAAATLSAIGLMIALAAAAPAAPVAMAQPAPVKPWVPNAETPCDWWLSGANGKELRASIGIGDDDPVLTVADTAFLPFSESDLVLVTLRFDRDDRRMAAPKAGSAAWSRAMSGCSACSSTGG